MVAQVAQTQIILWLVEEEERPLLDNLHHLQVLLEQAGRVLPVALVVHQLLMPVAAVVAFMPNFMTAHLGQREQEVPVGVEQVV